MPRTTQSPALGSESHIGLYTELIAPLCTNRQHHPFGNSWQVSASNDYQYASYSMRVYEEMGSPEAREDLRRRLKSYFDPFLQKDRNESCRIWLGVQNQRVDLYLRRRRGFNLTPTNTAMLAAMLYFTSRAREA